MSTSEPALPVASTSRFWSRVERFFFAEELPYNVAAIRILLPWALLFAAAPRWLHVRELYSTDGSVTPFWEGYGISNLAVALPPAFAMAAYTVMIFCMITMSLGWRTRTSIAVVMCLYPYFGMLDSLSTLTKYTVIATHVLLLLLFSGCGKVWSVDAWLEHSETATQTSSVWPRRLMQLLICFVYLGASVTKLRMPEYLTGDMMRFWMLTNTNFPNPLGEIMSQYPAMIVVMCHVALVWEILFPFLCWRGISRNVMLGIGVFFHVMTYFMLGLVVFPLLYLVLYFAFLDAHEVQRWVAACRRLLASNWTQSPIELTPTAQPMLSGITSQLTFAGVLVASILIAVSAEARMDVYGEHRAAGRHVLQPMSAEREAQLFPQKLIIRGEDKVFAFETGSTLLGGQLADPHQIFRHGDRVIAQCTLTPPHEDMWLEINLHDAQNHQIDRFGSIAPREHLRINAVYELTESLTPGTYALVLKLQGHEVARRHIELRSR